MQGQRRAPCATRASRTGWLGAHARACVPASGPLSGHRASTVRGAPSRAACPRAGTFASRPTCVRASRTAPPRRAHHVACRAGVAAVRWPLRGRSASAGAGGCCITARADRAVHRRRSRTLRRGSRAWGRRRRLPNVGRCGPLLPSQAADAAGTAAGLSRGHMQSSLSLMVRPRGPACRSSPQCRPPSGGAPERRRQAAEPWHGQAIGGRGQCPPLAGLCAAEA